MFLTCKEFIYSRNVLSAQFQRLTIKLPVNLNILDIFSIYSLQVGTFIYHYHNNMLPLSFCQTFQTGNQLHRYSTRHSDFYRTHLCRTNTKKFSLLFQGPKIWNSLHDHIIQVLLASNDSRNLF